RQIIRKNQRPFFPPVYSPYRFIININSYIQSFLRDCHMQRKKFLAAAIAIALQTSYAPVFAAETPDDDNDCPTNISSLSQKEKEKLSHKCLILLAEQDNHWGWISGGIAALAAGVAIGIENNGGDDAHHN